MEEEVERIEEPEEDTKETRSSRHTRTGTHGLAETDSLHRACLGL